MTVCVVFAFPIPLEPPAMSLRRRPFLQASAAGLAAAAFNNLLPAADETKSPEMKYKKAVKWYMVKPGDTELEKFELLKELGFDGIELDAPNGPAVEEVLAAKKETGLEVPGVVDSIHWKQTLSDPNAEVRAEGVKGLVTALEYAKAVGATSVLLVPGVVNDKATFDQAFERSIPEVKKVIPKAEELKIDILIENVWNNFLVDAKNMARFIDECGSPIVGSYFDVGNAVRYAPPHEWVPILGKRIKKLDIKDYKLVAEGGNLGEGFKAKLLEGSVDWPRVMQELKAVGFTGGWGTAEIPGGDREWLTDVAARMDKIFAS